ncbi:Mitochondrial intermembrane space cysteine motif-containing protein MIX17 [Penicillium canariense]|uniref:Mitochondrial intermembrane space cysteine motif-containing protein MIX17 n=1 Tax=Penicillium canariense TaxID=189055 RepID=A0A9W9HRA1_9EURO|nr:Mitochondrial intermembrane space cysteine motif-containing protein MIX17 [Penicillium canariense]KAJ5152971.1 Mitochondrial intermembrane space cysteine motif-containing protein MIX17 [Penicillium canariense]
MPRQQRRAAPTPARSAPTRPTAAPARPAPSPQQQQPHSTAAHPQAPPMQHAAPVQQSSGPGLFSTMASTAAGVAVGNVAAHGLMSAFGFGGSSHAPAEAQQAPPAENQTMDNGLWQSNATQQSWETPACEPDIRNFRRCMDENKGDMTVCGWYMDQLKACQAAAKPY